jgi:hypothetical protein
MGVRMSRMILAIALLFLYVSYISPTFKDKPPRNGLILQTGGVVSPWSAYVVDFDSGTTSFYQTGAHNGQKMRKFAGSRKLDPKIISDVRALADQAIAAHYSSSEVTADVDTRLEVSKDGKITETNTFGPVLDVKQPISSLQNLLSKQFHS